MNAPATRIWYGLVLEARYEIGHAARRNRGHYSGRSIHNIKSEYVVGLEASHTPEPGTVGDSFRRWGKPVLFSCFPLCGCTQGQMAATPIAAGAEVTCEKCKRRNARNAS